MVRTAAARLPRTSSATPIQPARKITCKALPSTKGETISEGIISRKSRYISPKPDASPAPVQETGNSQTTASSMHTPVAKVETHIRDRAFFPIFPRVLRSPMLIIPQQTAKKISGEDKARSAPSRVSKAGSTTPRRTAWAASGRAVHKTPTTPALAMATASCADCGRWDFFGGFTVKQFMPSLYV